MWKSKNETETTAKMGNYAQKSENFVYKFVIPKARKPTVIEPIQLVLEYLEFPYEIKKYEHSQAEEWFERDKKNLGLEMPNMPYLIKGINFSGNFRGVFSS